MTVVTSPEDESRTDSAWREIVENYGERIPLVSPEPLLEIPLPEPEDSLPPDDYEGEAEDIPLAFVTRSEHFRPPVPPPIPRPRTWQRGVAWAGVTVAPALGLLVALTQFYLPPLIGWSLVLWPIAGFAYLIFDMPHTPREPWDDGSRI